MAAPFTGVLTQTYRNPLDMTRRFFDMRHRDHFTIYDIRGRLEEEHYYPLDAFADIGGVVNRDFSFEDHCTSSVPRMVHFCEHVDAYLKEDPEHVAAVHCKAGKGRTGFMLSALYMFQGKAETVSDAIDLFSAQRTEDMRTVNRPSQIRFLGIRTSVTVYVMHMCVVFRIL